MITRAGTIFFFFLILVVLVHVPEGPKNLVLHLVPEGSTQLQSKFSTDRCRLHPYLGTLVNLRPYTY